MANREVVICSPVRTAIGTYGGTLKDTPAADLGAVVVRAALERAKLLSSDVDTVVMGNVIQAGNKMNPARQAAINGGGVSERLIVRTDGERVVRAQRTVMELLLTEAKIDPLSECGRVASAMELAGSRFPPPETHPPRDDSHLGIAVDLSKCIHCMRCVQACRDVEVNGVIGMAGRGRTMHVVFDFDDPMGQSTCVSCGSCAQTCPTGAIAFKAPPND